jgi:cell division septation protein DedD
VSDETPGVHYQISVTGRQAASFFFALLVALALAFFFGMRTGAAARKGPGAAATLAQASDVPFPTAAPATEAPASKRTDEVKLGLAAGAKGSEPKKAAPPEAPKEPTKSAPTAATPTKPTTTATAVPAKPTPAPKSAAKKEGPFFVQVLATQKADIADDMTKKLRADGFAADVTPVPGKAGWFRVRAGPYTDRSKAEAAAGKIQKAEKTKHRPIVVP